MGFDSEKDTQEHIFQVAERLQVVCAELRGRGERHDASKLGAEEKPYFDAVGMRLQGLVYGSDEYRSALQTLDPALKHHYATNSHHPEHYANGVAGMDLIDLIEMYCDWAAAALRTKDGDLAKSIDINIERFGIEGPLGEVLKNTRKRYGGFCGQPEVNAQIDREQQ